MTEAVDELARERAQQALDMINAHVKDCADTRREARREFRWGVGILITLMATVITILLTG